MPNNTILTTLCDSELLEAIENSNIRKLEREMHCTPTLWFSASQAL